MKIPLANGNNKYLQMWGLGGEAFAFIEWYIVKNYLEEKF